MKPVSVTFIGAGNVAWHLAPALDNTGFAVREVYSRKEKNSYALAERLYQCEPVQSLDFSSSASKVFIISVTDDAIASVVKELLLPGDAVLVHTSGSQPIDIIFGPTPSTGVLYPLMTFTKNRKVDFQDVPFLIESMDQQVEKLLIGMAKTLSKKVVRISSDERKALHVAAVFASNFTNHMLTLSKEIMIKNDLDFSLLKPLVAEMMNKSLSIGPEKVQTGPAKRGDLEILDKQFGFLSSDPPVAEIYKLISQHILDTYSEE